MAWATWCFLHSFLLSEAVRQRLERSQAFKRWGRLLFNLFSLVTVLPLILWTYREDGPLVYEWPRWLWPLRGTLIIFALYLFVAALKVYGIFNFLGLKYEPPSLKREGILSRMRHPLYTSGFILLWVRDQEASWFLVDLLLSVYLLVGTRLEERKLRRIFPEYESYQKEVPAFWPRLRRPIS